MGAENSGKHHFLVLDGMRGIAAIIVVLLHAVQLMQLRQGLGHAYLAVDFFFCLSGFVIAYAYEARLSGDMTFTDFVKIRLIRLYPVIFVGCLMGGAVMLSGNGIAATAVFTASAMLLFPAGLFSTGPAYPANLPVWSLFFEILANIVFALPVLRTWTWAILVGGLGIGYAVVCAAFDGIQEVGFANWGAFAAGVLRVGFPFAAGVLIFRLGSHHRSGVPSLVPLIGLPIILLLPRYHPAVEDAAIGLLFVPALVIVGTQNRVSLVGGSMMALLGELSYPLYLVHHPILRALRHLPLEQKIGWVGAYMLPILGLMISVAAAMVVSRYIDRPIRRWLSVNLSGNRRNQISRASI